MRRTRQQQGQGQGQEQGMSQMDQKPAVPVLQVAEPLCQRDQKLLVRELRLLGQVPVPQRDQKPVLVGLKDSRKLYSSRSSLGQALGQALGQVQAPF
jgi:hypothetical protein